MGESWPEWMQVLSRTCDVTFLVALVTVHLKFMIYFEGYDMGSFVIFIVPVSCVKDVYGIVMTPPSPDYFLKLGRLVSGRESNRKPIICRKHIVTPTPHNTGKKCKERGKE